MGFNLNSIILCVRVVAIEEPRERQLISDTEQVRAASIEQCDALVALVSACETHQIKSNQFYFMCAIPYVLLNFSDDC